MLTFFLIGVAIGIGTGIPIGPANVAVIDAAYRHTMRRAMGVATGSALADMVYAGIGIVAVGPLVMSNPSVPPVLYAISGVVLLVYGILTARSQPVSPAAADAPRSPHPSEEMWSGVTLGLALILLNPAAIVTWVVVVGPYLSEASHLERASATVGVLLGSFAWFSFVAYLTHHGKRLMGGRAVWITRAVGIGLIGYAVYSLYRAISYWAS